MASIAIKCKNCGSSNLNVRSSKHESSNTVKSECFCTNCFSRQTIISETICLKTPTFQDQPLALRYDKPFREVDPRQLDLLKDE